MNENWKLVRNSTCYEVSDLGNVRSIASTMIRKDGKKYDLKSQIMKQFVSKNGYCIIAFKRDINAKKTVHRLVMEAFCPVENMENLDVNHIDGNKENNKLSNLEWCTKHENMSHARKIGLWKPENRKGEKHPMHTLTEKEVKEIKELLLSKKYKQYEIAKMYNVSGTTISEIKTGRKWKHI